MSVEELVGHELAHAEPPLVSGAASVLEAMATTAAELRTRLLGTNTDLWEGQAANAFRRQQQHELPPQLQKLSTSFEACGLALALYGRRLVELQSQGRTLAGQLEDGRAEQRRCGAEVERTTSAVVVAAKRLAVAIEPAERSARQAEVARAKAALTRAKGAKTAADGRVARVLGSGAQVRAAHDAAVAVCTQAIDDAADAGIKNTIWSTIERSAQEISRQYLVPALESMGDFLDELAMWTGLIGGILMILSLFFPPLAAIGGPLVAIAFFTGALGLAMGVTVHGLKGMDRADTRSDAQIDAELWALAIGGVMMVAKPLRLVKKIRPVDRWLSKNIAKNGRPDPPRVYMNEARRQRKNDIIDSTQDVLWIGADHFWNPEERARQATIDAVATRRSEAVHRARALAHRDGLLHCSPPPRAPAPTLSTPQYRYYSEAPLAR